MKKIKKYNDKIYKIFVETDGYSCELRKGWCFKKQGVHIIRYNKEGKELINRIADTEPCYCKECANSTRLEDVVEENILLPKEDDIINNHIKSRGLSEEQLESWWHYFNYSIDDYRKVIRIVRLSNDKACYSRKEYPNLEYKGHYMCYDTLFKVSDVLKNKYISQESDCTLPEYRWEKININLKMDVYKTIMNAQINLEKYGISVKCA